MFMAPGREAVAMAGTATAARRYAASLLRRAIAERTSFVIVAEIGSEPVGFAEISHGGDIPSFAVVTRAAINAMGLVGALGAAWRSLARLKVDLPAPEGGAHLVELQVSPQHRNHGVGAFLLGEVDACAIEEWVIIEAASALTADWCAEVGGPKTPTFTGGCGRGPTRRRAAKCRGPL
jgi:GNAT superfamily N-acetyltransferase